MSAASYYASLLWPGPAGPGGVEDRAVHKRVREGNPMRIIAPCAACHGESDRKGAAPWLGGQSSVYLAAQLRPFASGQRRNVARNMTPEEIDGAARYYPARP
jgi:cytochrome c553